MHSSVGSLNVRGLRHKITEVCDLMISHDLDSICFIETELISEVSDCELQIPGYTNLPGMTEIILVGL